MWNRGLLITGREMAGTDLRPAALMSDLGRREFFTVMTEDAAAGGWKEKFDVVMISPQCTDPVPLLQNCLACDVEYVIVGSPRLSDEAAELLKEFRSRGGRAIGPGSQGFFDWEKKLALCWSNSVRVPESSPDARHVTLIAQGGGVPFSLYAMAVEAGVRFRRVISLGNCGDGDNELLRAMESAIADPLTSLLIVCLESLTRGRDFLAMTTRAAERKLPVVLLRVGEADQFGERLASRHPDANWTDRIMWNSVAGQYGVVLLRDAQQIVDLGKLSSLGVRSRGNRVAVLASSEGIAMLQADQCEAAGLDVVKFSHELQAKIGSRVPGWAPTQNPVDLSERVLKDGRLLSGILDDVQKSDECDMILLATGSLSASEGETLARAMSAVWHGELPMACCCLSRWRPLEEMVKRMNADGIPLFSSPRRVAEAMASLWRIGRKFTQIPADCKPAENGFLDSCPEKLSEYDAMGLVDAYGLKTVPHRFCRSVAEVIEAQHSLGFPLVLKVVSPSFASKQEVRAVALNLRTEEALRNAYGRILDRASRVHPDAVITGVFAQKMVTDGIECMIGIKRDPLFGPVVAVALGGAYYGLMRDISLRVAPVSIDTALDMIKSLKGYPLLSGEWFGLENDVDALARQIVTLSEMACAEPDIEILDINPIFVRPKGLGAEIADAFAVRRKKS